VLEQIARDTAAALADIRTELRKMRKRNAPGDRRTARPLAYGRPSLIDD
jgi:hypothetical protein